MRNYLYIPLGGNRVNSKFRLYFNLWIVFLASGFWHGASWSFIIWGAYHGIFLVLERSFLQKVYNKLGKLLSTIITFILVMIGWVFFRVEKVENAWLFIRRMFAFSSGNDTTLSISFYVFLSFAVFFGFFTYFKRGENIQNTIFFKENSNKLHIIMISITLILSILSIGSITASGFNPFIYFRF